jgi:hypothetical protein
MDCLLEKTWRAALHLHWSCHRRQRLANVHTPVNSGSFIRVPLRTALLWYLLANAVLLPFIFGDALWGKSLLAPLDIAPALFPKYRYVDPARVPIPANHIVIDGLIYDLPLQKMIHAAYRRGEVPWWDPYSLGGRPLLADAHVNGTDVFRVALDRLLPFELAFNWTRVTHFFLSGLGTLLLLRHLGFRAATCVLLAATHEFAAGSALFFCHPWIQGSFLFYPFLWLLWDSAMKRSFGWREGVAGVLAAGIFFSGNLQSHVYLPLFALAFCFGYAGKSFQAWKRAAGIIVTTGLLGAALAAPVLLNELELFFVGVRVSNLPAPGQWPSWPSGLMSLSGIFPWMLGTFRTLDLSKPVGEGGLGFAAYAGSVAFALTLAGLFLRNPSGPSPARRMAVWLLMIYFGLILSTPLKAFLYTRSSGLALLAFVVLAAMAADHLRSLEQHTGARRLGVLLLVSTAAIVIVTHVGALWIYPRKIEQVRALVRGRMDANDSALALREFQIGNFAREVTFQNPETIFAAAGLLALSAILLSPSWRRARGVWPLLLVLNAVPVWMFTHRYVPRHPVELWRQLEAGGPEQQRVASVVGEGRLLDQSSAPYARLFPGEMQSLQQVRTVHGYAALQPRGLFTVGLGESSQWREQLADWIYTTTSSSNATGTLVQNIAGNPARFQWRSGPIRPLEIRSEGLNRIRVAFQPDRAGELLWTDSPFPGWRALLDGREFPIRFVKPCFNSIEVPAGAHELVLFYRPTYLRPGCTLSIVGCIAIVFCVVAGAKTRRR